MSIFGILRRSPSLSIGLSLALLSSLLFIALTPDEARADNFVVNSVQDEPDLDPGDGDCEATVRQVDSFYSTDPDVTATTTACTLRAAIEETNALEGEDSITVPAGHYELYQIGANEDAANRGDLDITDDVTINGTGGPGVAGDSQGAEEVGVPSDFTLIDAEELGAVTGTAESAQAPPDRAFHIHGAVEVDINDVTIRGGVAGGNEGDDPDCEGQLNSLPVECNGGGIFIADSGASLTVSNSVLRGNRARGGGGPNVSGPPQCCPPDLLSEQAEPPPEGNGGAIYTATDTAGVEVTLNNTRLFDNMATGRGAIFIGGDDSTLQLNEGSMVESNMRGGIYIAGSGNTTNLVDSAVFRNNVGPGIRLVGEQHSLTVDGSSVDQNHDGILSEAVTSTISVIDGSTVSGNHKDGVEVSGPGSGLTITNSTIGGERAWVRGEAQTGGNQGNGVLMIAPESTANVTDSFLINNHRSGFQAGLRVCDLADAESIEAEPSCTDIDEEDQEDVGRIDVDFSGGEVGGNIASGIAAGTNVDLDVQGTDVLGNHVTGILVRPFWDVISGTLNNQTINLDGARVNRNNVRGLWVVQNEEDDLDDDPDGAEVTIANSTFNYNNVGGIEIRDQGATLDLVDSAVYHNRAGFGGGVALGNYDENDDLRDLITSTIDGSTIAHNHADEQGGGVWNAGLLTVVNSTFSANLAAAEGFETVSDDEDEGGGGLYNDIGGHVNLEYGTMFRNQTTLTNPGEDSRGTCPVDQFGNAQRCYAEGEAIFNDGDNEVSGTIEVTATIVALDITTTPTPQSQHFRENCGGQDPSSLGDNIEDMDTCTFHNANDLVNTDPDLYALRDHGSTEVHMPEPGSPAIDHDDDCSEEVDQRDEPRGDDEPCDTGSVEVQGAENEPTDCPSGTDFCVNNEYDHVPDGCDPGVESAPETGPDCTLREAVIEANERDGPDTIFLPEEDYFLTHAGTSEDFSQTGDLDVTSTLTVIGEQDENDLVDEVEDQDMVEPGSVIDATYLEALTTTAQGGNFIDDPPDRIWHLPFRDTDLTLENITTQHGKTTHSDDRDSTEVGCGGSFGPESELDCNGGGIYVEQPTSNLTITDSWVFENRAVLDGGGINFEGGLGSVLTIDSSRIAANRSDDEGGGIHTEEERDAQVVIDGSTIGGERRGTMGGRLGDGNSADTNGGGVDLGGERALLQASDSLFQGNRAGSSGGAIDVDGTLGAVELEETDILDNQADSGGGGIGLSGERASVDMDGGEVVGNVASGDGGGINLDNDANEVVLNGTDLRGNRSDSDGGAIANDDEGDTAEVSITGGEILQNKADSEGGALFFDDVEADVTIDGVVVRENMSDDRGSSIFIGDGALTVTDSEFLYNKTDDNAAAVFLQNSTARITGSDFHDNKADSDGGAIYVQDDAGLRLNNTNFKDNVADGGRGGAIYNEGTAMFADDVWFSYNLAADQGGALFNGGQSGGAEARMEGVTFSDNRAEGGNGGAGVGLLSDEGEGPPPGVNPGENGGGPRAEGEPHPRDVHRGGAASEGDKHKPENAGGGPPPGSAGEGPPEEKDEGPPPGEGPPPEDEGGPPEGEGPSNREGGSGGAIYNQGPDGSGSFLRLVNSTLSRNEDQNHAGGIYNDGELILRFNTIYDHETDLRDEGNGLVPGPGGAIYNDSAGTIEAKGNIVANTEGENCEQLGTVNSLGFNFEDQDTCDFDDSTDQPNTDPQLGQLRDNGGFTPTHAPREGSPVIDYVDPAECPPPAVDQRDETRPQGEDEMCDSGSVEGAEGEQPTPTPTETDDDGDGGGGAGPQPDLDVQPEDADNNLAEDDTHTLEAEVERDEGDPVDFKIISGPNAQGGNTPDFSCDPSGDDDSCTVEYEGEDNGTDVICGWIDSDNDNVFDPDGSDADGGDCEGEAVGETESNDETDVVEKGWTGAGASPSPTRSPSPSPTFVPRRCRNPKPGYNVIVGTTGDDVLRGTNGNDLICARAGDDVARGLRGRDIIWLGAGRDRGFGGRGFDRIRGNRHGDRIEANRGGDHVTGGRGRDRIFGNAGADRLFGMRGRDRLRGGLGPDKLAGGPGFDFCFGGPGVNTTVNCEAP